MVQITDSTGANVVEVDPTLKAMRVTQRPMECLGWYSFGLKTGAMPTLAAGSTLLSLRYTGSNLLAIRRIGMGAVTSTFSAAGLNDYAAYIARSFTGADSGGSSITLTGNNNKHRTSAAALSGGSLNVGTTAGLTVGTRTLDSQALGTQAYWSSVAGSNLIAAPERDLQRAQAGADLLRDPPGAQRPKCGSDPPSGRRCHPRPRRKSGSAVERSSPPRLADRCRSPPLHPPLKRRRPVARPRRRRRVW